VDHRSWTRTTTYSDTTPTIAKSASVAHIYGQNLAAAESMTSCDSSTLGRVAGTLKPTADMELLNGINRFCHSRVGTPATGGQSAWNDTWPLRTVVQSQ